ncbi:acyltransferase [Chryseobacterium suipulveris]|uniref:Acyltransferase n=1 Tax=Chryseobacterium suipulveris TaxID=2929800 RepID=A0ABY4BQQ0_9FLAO|nr:acyltransferase [Chryseobacterium suipulveris]UOE41527.1 acyltransferase [Chryseobacterium suipulveris]
MQKNKSIYLPGLNGIRAIAAMSVIVSHIGLNLKLYDIPNFGGYSLANFGVTMFFALSGFLITYLLLKEKEKMGTIAIRKFYFRRLLRIWPLYYFYLIVTLVVLGFSINSYSWMYLFMLPNVPFALEAASVFPATLPHLAHYWSVGVEEQFYGFWPWFIKKSKRLFRILVGFAVFFFLIKVLLTVLNAPKFIVVLFHYTRFGCLGMGGIAAFLLVKGNKSFLSIFQNRIVELCAWFVFLLISINQFHLFSIVDHEIATLATLVIIINQVNNQKKLISLENKVFDYLGKISYGLYIYNPLIIFLISFVLKDLLTSSLFVNLILIYSVTILVVILVSHLSYFYFESKFLKWKDKFAVVKSKSSYSK